MSIDQVRTTIVNALDDANATEHLKPSLLTAFEGGREDIALADLGLDSLKRMELMVALEMEHDAVIPPRQFMQFSSLGDIVSHVEGAVGAGRVGDVEQVGETPSPLERERTKSERVIATGAEASLAVDPSAVDPRRGQESTSSIRSDPDAAIERLFKRALRGCRTVAHLNKALGSLENRITPLELAALSVGHQRGKLFPEGTPGKYERALSEWLNQLERNMERSGKVEPEPFVSSRLAPAAAYYRGPGERKNKTLLICFAISGGRYLFIPNCVLLQHIDARKYDILILSDPWDTAFRGGVPQMGTNVTEVVHWIAGLELLSNYARLRTMGCSAGGYPAMLVGRRVGAELAVSIAGRIPHKRYVGQIARMAFNSWVSYRGNKSSRALVVYCKAKRRDKSFARLIGRVAGAQRLSVEMPGRELGHDMLGPLLKHGDLANFLERTLFAPQSEDPSSRKRTESTMRFQAC